MTMFIAILEFIGKIIPPLIELLGHIAVLYG